MNKTVTVFGSSIPKPGDSEYETALSLGRILGENKLNVCTGGYQGIMDAVSRGASEKGAEALGVTVNILNALPSKYLTKKIETDSLMERIKRLVEFGDAYIILQGGTGTLLELAVVWEYLNKRLIMNKPVVCHGVMWSKLIKIIDQRLKAEGRVEGLVKCFDDIEKCANYIINELKIH